MALRRKWKRIALTFLMLFVLSSVILQATGRKIFVYNSSQDLIAFEGDILVPANDATVGPGYNPRETWRVCVYWTGLSFRPFPRPPGQRCPWITPG